MTCTVFVLSALPTTRVERHSSIRRSQIQDTTHAVEYHIHFLRALPSTHCAPMCVSTYLHQDPEDAATTFCDEHVPDSEAEFLASCIETLKMTILERRKTVIAAERTADATDPEARPNHQVLYMKRDASIGAADLYSLGGVSEGNIVSRRFW